MKIMLHGAGFSNKGAEAMLRTVQTEIVRRVPSAEFFVWRPAPADTSHVGKLVS